MSWFLQKRYWLYSNVITLLQCTVFQEAYILSGFGFHEFLYSIIKSLKKIVKLLSLFLISCVFTEKTLANFHDMEISLVVLPCHFID